MAKMTITEALSEVNLIKKKIKAGEDSIKSVLFRPKHAKDAFEKDGGSADLITRSRQSILSLHRRLEKIRGAVSKANLEHEITVGEQTKTIFDWLTWKREISAGYLSFVSYCYTQTRNQLQSFEKNPQCYEDADGKKQLVEIIPNIDIGAWLRESEILTETIEKLDGQLSLKNATIVVDI